MYRYYQVMICLLKFDFFCFTGVTIQVRVLFGRLSSLSNRSLSPHLRQLLILVLQVNSAEFGITIAAIPIVLILLAMCGVAVQREIKM